MAIAQGQSVSQCVQPADRPTPCYVFTRLPTKLINQRQKKKQKEQRVCWNEHHLGERERERERARWGLLLLLLLSPSSSIRRLSHSIISRFFLFLPFSSSSFSIEIRIGSRRRYCSTRHSTAAAAAAAARRKLSIPSDIVSARS